MNHAQRAAIASAFIFPGAGLFLLKHYLRGCIFAVPAALIVAALCLNLLKVATQLSKDIAGQMISIELITSLHDKLHAAFFESPYWHQGKWILLASWLLSIASSYYAGKQLDRHSATHNPT